LGRWWRLLCLARIPANKAVPRKRGLTFVHCRGRRWEHICWYLIMKFS